MSGPVDNTVNNGVISAALISNIVSTVNSLYDFCVDLGLDQPATSKKAIYTRKKAGGALAFESFGADEVRFFSARYNKDVNGVNLLASFNVNFGGVFSEPPDVVASARVAANKGYVYACTSNVTKDGCKVHIYNPTTTKYDGVVVTDVFAIGIEKAST